MTLTQHEFDALPLLLRRAQVFAVAPGLDEKALYAYRDEGEMRTFRPVPESAFAYYFRADLARICGLSMRMPVRWEGLPEWLRAGEFRAVTGLARTALDEAVAHDMLAAVRRREDGNRWFYRADLGWFL